MRASEAAGVFRYLTLTRVLIKQTKLTCSCMDAHKTIGLHLLKKTIGGRGHTAALYEA